MFSHVVDGVLIDVSEAGVIPRQEGANPSLQGYAMHPFLRAFVASLSPSNDVGQVSTAAKNKRSFGAPTDTTLSCNFNESMMIHLSVLHRLDNEAKD